MIASRTSWPLHHTVHSHVFGDSIIFNLVWWYLSNCLQLSFLILCGIFVNIRAAQIRRLTLEVPLHSNPAQVPPMKPVLHVLHIGWMMPLMVPPSMCRKMHGDTCSQTHVHRPRCRGEFFLMREILACLQPKLIIAYATFCKPRYAEKSQR